MAVDAAQRIKELVRADRAELGRRLTEFMGQVASVALQYDADGYFDDHRSAILDSLVDCYAIMDLVDRIDLLEEVSNAR